MPARAHGHDTTLARAALRPRYGAGRAGRAGAGAQAEARGACGRDATIRQLSLRHGQGLSHDTAGSRPRYGHGVRPWARLGASWASFGARAPDSVFDLVFDSVLFLSHRLDPVHEHCSSQKFLKFFLKKIKLIKNEIKSNKIFEK